MATVRLATALLVFLFLGLLHGRQSIEPIIVDSAVGIEHEEWIVLLESDPVSRYQIRLDTGRARTSGEIRGYANVVKSEQLRFLEAAQRAGLQLEVRHAYSLLLNGVAVSLPAHQVTELARLPGFRTGYPDEEVQLTVYDSVVQTGADQAWQMVNADGRPVTGEGVRVAIIDTGIDYTHPDLGGCFGAGCRVVEGYDLHNDDPDPFDDNGHGTHCAGIVAADGELVGMAPGAELYAYKVLNAYGSGSTSTIIAGIERAADPDQDPATDDAVDIISMSLGLPGSPADPWPQAVDAAAELGILMAVSAGNSGPDYESVESPGVTRLALTVGAVDKSDQLAQFSSRGPIPGYDGWLKPDILAPGVDIVSTYPGGLYASSSGTSMAAPHAAGAAALIKQMYPFWTQEMIRASLMNNAVDLGLSIHEQGAGRLQVDQALLAPGIVMPASINFGVVDITEAIWSDTRWLYLQNVFPETLTFNLSTVVGLPENVLLSVEPDELTLAPGENGRFSVVLAFDPGETPPDMERNQGEIHIQQGDHVLRVPVAFQHIPLFFAGEALPAGLQTSYAVALADLDLDGDLDAFIGNTTYYDNPANTVWFNDGDGNFSDSGQRLGNVFTWDVALGDVDNDGDLDAFLANSEPNTGSPNEVWLNDGAGYFVNNGQPLGSTLSRSAALGDLDGDGDLDAFVASGIASRGPAQSDRVWWNDGAGNFTDSGQRLGTNAGLAVALGDLDGDGDLDAFVANGDRARSKGLPNTVWWNNGMGQYSDSGQNLGDAISNAVMLVDLDGDEDLDAFIGNGGELVLDRQPDEVWWNDGGGQFSDSGQALGLISSYGVAIGDLHKDGKPDVLVAGLRGGSLVWLNDGAGYLSLSSTSFSAANAADAALGDLDGDGDLDALMANAIGAQNQIWWNRDSGSSPPGSPEAPDSLRAAVASDGQILLEWMDRANDETAFYLERAGGDEEVWQVIAVLPADHELFADDTVLCGLAYSYRVRAYIQANSMFSMYSHPAAAFVDCPVTPTPSPPATSTSSATPSPTALASPTASNTASATISPSPTASSTPSLTTSPSPTASNTASATISPTPTASFTPSPITSPTPTASSTPSATQESGVYNIYLPLIIFAH